MNITVDIHCDHYPVTFELKEEMRDAEYAKVFPAQYWVLKIRPDDRVASPVTVYISREQLAELYRISGAALEAEEMRIPAPAGIALAQAEEQEMQATDAQRRADLSEK